MSIKIFQALDSIEGEIIPSDDVTNDDTAKNFAWPWRFWPPTATTPTVNSDASSNDFSTVDNSEILYDFSCFDKTFIDSATSPSTSSSSTSSPAANSECLHLSTFSTSSPSNFSSTPPSIHSSDGNDDADVDVDMTSLISTYCTTPDVAASPKSTESANGCLNLAPKTRTKVSAKKFDCSFCEKTFLSRHYFRFHVASVHTKKKDSTCSLCLKSFGGDYYLKQV